MKQKSFKIVCILLIVLCNQKLLSQTTTTITYDTTSGLSLTKCNVFAPPLVVGGKTHTSVIGAATYSNANGLALPTNYNINANKTERSDFRISYSFKSGYSYVIKFTAFAQVSSGSSYPTIGAALFTAGGLTNTSTSCAAGDISGFPQIGSLFISGLNSTSTEYTPANGSFVSPSNYDYLLLEAYMTATSISVS